MSLAKCDGDTLGILTVASSSFGDSAKGPTPLTPLRQPHLKFLFVCLTYEGIPPLLCVVLSLSLETVLQLQTEKGGFSPRIGGLICTYS